jgi:Tfp pilus assembly protein PilV
MRLRVKREAGVSLPELMIAAIIMGIFFSGIFEVTGICLRYISSSKENISAVECVHDRIEQIRGSDFTNVLDPTFMSATPAANPPQRRNLTVPSNASPLASNATETVTISTFSGTSATTPKVTYVRQPGATWNTTTAFSDTNVTPSVTWTGGATLSAATAVQVDVTYSWNSVLGGRPLTESSSTIICAGTKK